MTTATMNVSLPDDMKQFIEDQTQKEGFGSVSEYLHAVIRDIQKRQAKRELEAKLLEGLNSGPAGPLTTEEWDVIEREGLARAATRRQGS